MDNNILIYAEQEPVINADREIINLLLIHTGPWNKLHVSAATPVIHPKEITIYRY